MTTTVKSIIERNAYEVRRRVEFLEAEVADLRKTVGELRRRANDALDAEPSSRIVTDFQTLGCRRVRLACSLIGMMTSHEFLCSMSVREHAHVYHREVVVWLLRNTKAVPSLSLPEIATAIGVSSHSTVLTILNRLHTPDELGSFTRPMILLGQFSWLDRDRKHTATRHWIVDDVWEVFEKLRRNGINREH